MLPAKRIILVDDDEVTNMINTTLIKKVGGATVEAYTKGALALECLKSQPAPLQGVPLIVLLDINMPEMDGWEFLEEFQKLPTAVTTSCKIFMLSSSVDRGDIAKSKTYPVVSDFISKPLTIDLVRTMVAEW